MAEDTTSKLDKGTWANMEAEKDRNPRMEFELNKSVTVTFPTDFVDPKELPDGKGGVFYVFTVVHNGQLKDIGTSAWTLLRGFKELMPLAGKTVAIAKEMDKGKQNFTVTEVEGVNGIPIEKAA